MSDAKSNLLYRTFGKLSWIADGCGLISELLFLVLLSPLFLFFLIPHLCTIRRFRRALRRHGRTTTWQQARVPLEHNLATVLVEVDEKGRSGFEWYINMPISAEYPDHPLPNYTSHSELLESGADADVYTPDCLAWCESQLPAIASHAVLLEYASWSESLEFIP